MTFSILMIHSQIRAEHENTLYVDRNIADHCNLNHITDASRNRPNCYAHYLPLDQNLDWMPLRNNFYPLD